MVEFLQELDIIKYNINLTQPRKIDL